MVANWTPHKHKTTGSSDVATDLSDPDSIKKMYEKVGIAREDRPARQAWMAQNFNFFGAPVGLFFVLDEGMGHGIGGERVG